MNTVIENSGMGMIIPARAGSVMDYTYGVYTQKQWTVDAMENSMQENQ